MPDVTAAHLRALADLQREILRGTWFDDENPADLTKLGPLALLVADDVGWRRDATAVVRRLLDRLLAEWLASDHEPEDETSRGGGQAKTDDEVVVRVLRMIWGISMPPQKATTARKLGGATGVAPGTVRSWPTRVFRDSLATVADLLAETQADDATPPETLTGSPADWAGPPGDWPPFGDDDAPSDHDLLIERAARLAEPAGPYGEREYIATIRMLATRALRGRYLHDPTDRFVRHVEHGILDVWDDLDLVLFGVAPGAVNHAAHLPSRAAIAIVQMFCFDTVLDDGDESRRRFRSALEQRRGGERFLLTNRRAEWADVVNLVSKTGRVHPGSVEQPRSLVPSQVELVLFHDTEPLSPEVALQVSNYVRGTRPDKGAVLEQYVHKRELLIRESPVLRASRSSPSALTLYSLADQGVHLEIMNWRDRDLSRRMAAVIEHYYGGNYYILAQRNLALDRNKVGDHAGAAYAIDQVYAIAKELVGGGVITDLQEQLETLHQISLAATGILTSTVEDRLTRRRVAGDRVLGQYVEALLRWSGLLVEYLDELEFFVGGLPGQRHDDQRHIFWKDWAVTTAHNRSRALLVAHTAVHGVGGLALPSDSTYDVSLPVVNRAYRKVIGLENLTPATEGVLVMQATWLAMLNGGWLPAHIELDDDGSVVEITTALANMRLLDGDPEATVDEDPRFPFRHMASAMWHIERGDGGKLAELRRSSLASIYLKKRGGRAFVEWYEMLEGAGLTPHDDDASDRPTGH